MGKYYAIKKNDPQIFKALEEESKRQTEGIELIPSENYTSITILQATGSIFTNKYSEGYPGRRYYGGNKVIDQVENLAIMRVKKLFNAEHANVQSFSGAPANLATYFALLEFGDKILGMDLSSGGHLTHGSKVNFSGKLFNCIFYTVDRKTGCLDYDQIFRIAKKEKPRLIIAGATAYPRKIDFSKFAEISKNTGAYLMVDMAHIAGLIAAGIHMSPVPYADVITSTTHKTLRGPRGAFILSKEKYGSAIDRAVFPAIQAGPHEHIIAAKAVCFKEAMTSSFKKYVKQIVKNSQTLAEELLKYGFNLVTGGTDNHLILIDLINKGITGKQAQNILDMAGIIVNKNTIPFETRSPFDPSGIRLGTPAVTTRGMKEKEMRIIAKFINDIIENHQKKEKIKKIRKSVKEFASSYPIPGYK